MHLNECHSNKILKFHENLRIFSLGHFNQGILPYYMLVGGLFSACCSMALIAC